jgi:hypothetical protein
MESHNNNMVCPALAVAWNYVNLHWGTSRRAGVHLVMGMICTWTAVLVREEYETDIFAGIEAAIEANHRACSGITFVLNYMYRHLDMSVEFLLRMRPVCTWTMNLTPESETAWSILCDRVPLPCDHGPRPEGRYETRRKAGAVLDMTNIQIHDLATVTSYEDRRKFGAATRPWQRAFYALLRTMFSVRWVRILLRRLCTETDLMVEGVIPITPYTKEYCGKTFILSLKGCMRMCANKDGVVFPDDQTRSRMESLYGVIRDYAKHTIDDYSYDTQLTKPIRKLCRLIEKLRDPGSDWPTLIRLVVIEMHRHSLWQWR